MCGNSVAVTCGMSLCSNFGLPHLNCTSTCCIVQGNLYEPSQGITKHTWVRKTFHGSNISSPPSASELVLP